ncbi:MAG: hypothetical protein P8Y70_19980 [Candidatus Lokiarchaeota archaeon]
MEFKNNFFERIKESNDYNELNDILINLAKEPHPEYLNLIEFIIENKPSKIQNKIIINIAYLLGKIGENLKIDEIFLHYLRKNYSKQDRWVRNEIIKALKKLESKNYIKKIYINILEKSLREDYEPIILNSLEILEKMDDLPDNLLTHIFELLNNASKEAKKKLEKILRIKMRSEMDLFAFLSESKRYEILRKEGIRNLLLIFFETKILFLKEIDTFQRILLQLR